MKIQEIVIKFNKQLEIENYSSQTIKSYSSALKLFLDYLQKLQIEKITDKEIQDYLYICKTEKKYSFSAMKQSIAAIRYLYIKILDKPIPKALDIKLRKPDKLPVVLSKQEIQNIIKVTKNLKHSHAIPDLLGRVKAG